MSIINIFKKKKIKETKKEKDIKDIKSKKLKKQSKEISGQQAIKKSTKKRKNQSWGILKPPHITEKATELATQNQYVFKVDSKANKIEIKKALQDIYQVDVLNVRIINVLPKRKRLGKIKGWKTGYKKAIIKIKKGQTIEVLPR